MLSDTPYKKPRLLAVANQKGGVGKTTTAVNLATAMVACKCKVLLIDLDPQGNASTGVGLPANARKKSTYQVLLGKISMEKCIQETEIPGMYVAPSTVDLSGAELELIDLVDREKRLLKALEKTDLTRFDYVLIDCPPALGLLTLNALVAAEAVLVPVQAEFYALEGLSHLLRTLDRVRKILNPDLKLQGIVLTMYDGRNNLCDMVAKDVRKFLGDKVYNTMIPRNVRISEAPSHGKPVLLYDLKCAGSQAYLQLAKEVLKREKALLKAI